MILVRSRRERLNGNNFFQSNDVQKFSIIAKRMKRRIKLKINKRKIVK